MMMMTQKGRNKHHINAYKAILLEQIEEILLPMERDYKDSYFPSIFNRRPSMEDTSIKGLFGLLQVDKIAKPTRNNFFPLCLIEILNAKPTCTPNS